VHPSIHPSMHPSIHLILVRASFRLSGVTNNIAQSRSLLQMALK
jgi:hypothetical protein